MSNEPPESVFEHHDLSIGDVKEFAPDHAFGRYRIERSLGSGAMATVMLATDTVLGRKVALKVPLLKPGSSDRLIQKRFLREAKAAASLSHPNICPIHDVGIVEKSLYISMAYIEGISLVQVMEETEKFEEKEVAQIVRSIAAAASEAHNQGVLHRDLKPGNIMIDRRGEPVVLDFGLASFYHGTEESSLSIDGHTLGTPSYMSPEQALGEEELTPATDIYSLGVIMWELLTGERLFSGDSMDIMGKIVHGEIPKPSLKRPGLAPEMQLICLKALAKAPQDRYRSMDEYIQAIESWLQLQGVGVVGGSGSGLLLESQSDISAAEIHAVLDQTRHELEVVSRVREQRWMLVIAVLACIIGVLLWLLLGQTSSRGIVPDLESDSGSNQIRPPESFPTSPQETAFFDPPRNGFSQANPRRQFFPDPEMRADEIFAESDTNSDRRLEVHEFPPHIIQRADRNGDQVLTYEELKSAIDTVGGYELMAPRMETAVHNPDRVMDYVHQDPDNRVVPENRVQGGLADRD